MSEYEGQCALCGKTYTVTAEIDAAAKAEAHEKFPGLYESELVQLCDACYQSPVVQTVIRNHQGGEPYE